MAGSVPAIFFVGPIGGLSPAKQLRKQFEAAPAFVGPKASFVSLTVELPVLNAAGLLAALPGQPLVSDAGTIGLGVAAELRLDHLDVAAARDWASRMLADENIGGREAPSIFCGAAFAPEATGTGRWRDFPAFYLLLPRWIYREDWDSASLTLTLPAADLGDPGRQNDAVGEIESLIACLAAGSAEEPAGAKAAVQMPTAEWEAMVDDALGEISAGRFKKLVIARTATIEASEPWNPASIFRRLMSSPGSSPFAVRLGARTFLGASPELLIGSGGQGHFQTYALAGTIPAGSDTAGLTQSRKNREEHRLVVEEIERRLRPLCSEIEVAREPAVVPLIHVAHLRTPISGRRRKGVHLLDLAGALHPTPAVGGLPGKPAVEWICAHEPEPRGWYAGFVGWLERSGGGRLHVAIRSGLVSGHEARLYTGAGIVAGSDPAGEYQETGWKQRPFLRALGVEQ